MRPVLPSRIEASRWYLGEMQGCRTQAEAEAHEAWRARFAPLTCLRITWITNE